MEDSFRSTGHQTGPAARSAPIIRPARQVEIDAMLALFADEVRAGKMLPRDPATVAAQLGDWLAAEDDGRIVGCVSLVFFNEELCELRSLAVHPEHRGNGLGGELIRAAVELARQRGMRRVLTLTRAVGVFERAGFARDLVGNYPEKVWRDCAPCPFRERCDEVALIYPIEPIGSGSARPRGNGNGNHRASRSDPVSS